MLYDSFFINFVLCFYLYHSTHAFHEGEEDGVVYHAHNDIHARDVEVINNIAPVPLKAKLAPVDIDNNSKNSEQNLNKLPTTVSDLDTVRTSREAAVPKESASTSAGQKATTTKPNKSSSQLASQVTDGKVTKPSSTTAMPTKTGGQTSGNGSSETNQSSTESSVTTTTKPICEKSKLPVNNLYCLCDLHSNACDMNCCCDIDCSEEDRALFTKCEDGVGLLDSRSVSRRQRTCFQNFVFFKHFDVYNLERNDKGMLCIVRDNNKEDNILSTKTINEIREKISKGTINIKQKYEWNKYNHFEYEKKPYKYLSPILGVKPSDTSENKKLYPLGLPSVYHETSCSVLQPIRFLEDTSSRCRLSLLNLTQTCVTMNNLNANFFFQSLDILTNPEKDEIVLKTKGKSCNGDLCSFEQTQELNTGDFPNPKLNLEKSLCQDILVGLDLTFYHNGIDGVDEVVANVELQDVNLEETDIFQEYKVKFIWSPENNENSTNSTLTEIKDWPRSGNPGYIVGKPVIMGKKVQVSEPKNASNSEDQQESQNQIPKDNEQILVWKDPSRWLTIHSPGICSKNPIGTSRASVLFDYGHSTTCSLNTTTFKYCEDLQIEVAKIFFGTNDSISFEKGDWYVAAYGNSNPKEPSEWVPLKFKNFPIISITKGSSKTLISKGCEGISATLHIRIAYAFVGSIDFPQTRITGVLYELGDSTPIPGIQNEICTQTYCQIHQESLKELTITTTVTFKDVTASPVTRIAKWPVLSIRLPADFFYPFSSPSSSSKNVFSKVLILLALGRGIIV